MERGQKCPLPHNTLREVNPGHCFLFESMERKVKDFWSNNRGLRDFASI